MPEFTVVHCGIIQPHNSKWAPSPKKCECTICHNPVGTWHCVYGPKLPIK